ncbi:MAG: 30S ribosomal protein S10 [Candidatus Nanoarchaeia archaeon]|nr:30S ribosomal protein S10 [Candidatus Nanoarchaeia archaeon]
MAISQKTRIKLNSSNQEKLDLICSQIIDIAKKIKVKHAGPIVLPTKRLKVPVRKSPCGSGRETYETWEMRVHKRVIDLETNERALRLIMRVQIPKDVNIEIEIPN